MLESGNGLRLVGSDGSALNGTGEDSRVVENPDYKPRQHVVRSRARGVAAGFCFEDGVKKRTGWHAGALSFGALTDYSA